LLEGTGATNCFMKDWKSPVLIFSMGRICGRQPKRFWLTGSGNASLLQHEADVRAAQD